MSLIDVLSDIGYLSKFYFLYFYAAVVLSLLFWR